MYDPEISLRYDVVNGDISKHIDMKLAGEQTESLHAILNNIVEFLQAIGFSWLDAVVRNEAGDFVIYSHKVH